jgi:hypothetical protein
MRCHSCSGQPSGLLFQKTMGAVTTGKKPTGGGERISASHTRGDETRTSALEEDHSRLGMHAQIVGLNAETRMGRYSAAGEDFSLDIPFYRTSRLVTNAFPNQGSVIQDALVRCKSLQRTKKAARSGPHLADSLTSYYLALAGGTMPFIRRYSTI